MRFKKILISAVAALMGMTVLASCGERSDLRLGTGNPGGIYYAYGTTLHELDEAGVTVKKTEGSMANMRLMKEGFLDLAIVQSDILAEAAYGTGDFEGSPVSVVRAVAGLYYEAFQIIVRSDSGIESLADLRGKKMSIGEDGSGVARNAEYMLLSAGIPYTSVETVNMSYAESAAALEGGDIDALFVILGAPSTVVSELAESVDIRILPLDERTVSSMTNIYDGYYSMTIPAGTYHGQEEDVPTVGVKAVLTASEGVSAAQVEEITRLLFDSSTQISYSVSVPEPDIDFAVTGIPCRFHDGAAEYYRGAGVTVSTDQAAGTGIAYDTRAD